MEQVGNCEERIVFNSKEESKTNPEQDPKNILSWEYMIWNRVSNGLFDYEANQE